MTKQVNFRPKVKSINIANEELTKITLEVKNNSLDGKLDELRKFSNKVVTVIISEETIEYTVPVNKQTKKPNVEYVVNADGTIDMLKEEQTSLDVGVGVEEVENVKILVSKETIDEFIKTATTLVNKQTKKPNVEYVVNADGTIDMLKEEQTSLDVGDGVEEVENIEFLVSKETVDEFIKTATTLQLPENVTVNIRDVLIRLAEGDSMNEIAADHELSETALIDQIELARQYFAPYADSWSKHKDDIIFPEKQ